MLLAEVPVRTSGLRIVLALRALPVLLRWAAIFSHSAIRRSTGFVVAASGAVMGVQEGDSCLKSMLVDFGTFICSSHQLASFAAFRSGVPMPGSFPGGSR